MPTSPRLAAAVFAAAAAAGLMLAASPARAEEDWFGPEALGMGGAARTLGIDTTGLHLNPASMVAQAAYLGSFSYSYYGRERSHLFATSAMDSRTSAFALGTSYSVRVFQPPFVPETDLAWVPLDGETELRDRRTYHRWDVAAAYGFLQRRLSLGLTARILRQRFDLYADRTRFTLDGGLAIWVSKAFGLSVSAQNFVPTRDDLYPVRLSAGAALVVDRWIRAAVDVVWDFTSQAKVATDLRGGAELTIYDVVSLRAGYYGDRRFTDHYLTWGLGLNAPKLRIAYAMRIELGKMEKRLREGVPEANNRILNTIGMELVF